MPQYSTNYHSNFVKIAISLTEICYLSSSGYIKLSAV